ncbi:MAG: hypothetical protein JXR83_02570 [Deltaproteobacteria bacterium]|nr:hypothetical protein [Deltaproteobacteria bacterium]
MPQVWTLQAGTRWDPAQVGGKAASVARLAGVPGTRLPRSAVWPVAQIQRWLAAALGAGQRRRMARAWERGDDDHETRERLQNTGVPMAVARRLRACFRHDAVLMVRSSAVMEDGQQSSFAGHFETSACTADTLEAALVHCAWHGVRAAFVYGTPAHWPAARRLERALRSLALLVQRASTSEVAGVVFTRSPLHPDAMMVVAAYGTCHAVVDGALPVDTYVVWPDSSELQLSYKEQMTVLVSDVDKLWPGQGIDTPLGTATFLLPYGPLLGLATVPRHLAGYPALSDDQLSEVCGAASLVAKRLGQPIDMEWCIDEGDLTLLQARPVTAVTSKAFAPPDLKAHGRLASPGVASGPARILKDLAQVPRAMSGDLLVVGATDPAWLPAFYRAAGVISEEGSPLSHTAIVARELGIPCLVGVQDATRGRFLDGEWLRLDADRGLVQRTAAGQRRGRASATRPRGQPSLCVDLRWIDAPGVRRVTASALLDDWLRRAPAGELRPEQVLARWRQVRARCRPPGPALKWDLAPTGDSAEAALTSLRAMLARG